MLSIQILKPFKQNYRVGVDFVDKTSLFLTENCSEYLSDFFGKSGKLTATALNGGHSSVVYRVESDTGKRCVVKFAINRTYFWQEYSGYRIAPNVGVLTPKIINLIQEPEKDVWGFVFEYMDLPLLTKSDKPAHFKELGRAIRALHAIKIEGFGAIEYGATRGVSDDPNFLLKKYEDFDSLSYLLEKELLTRNQLNTILKKTSMYKYKETARAIHGDIRHENVFFNSGKIIVFDFWTAAADPLIDLALYSYKSLSENWRTKNDSFLTGYRRDFDENRLELLIASISIRKAAKNHRLRRDAKWQWALKHLIRYANE